MAPDRPVSAKPHLQAQGLQQGLLEGGPQPGVPLRNRHAVQGRDELHHGFSSSLVAVGHAGQRKLHELKGLHVRPSHGVGGRCSLPMGLFPLQLPGSALSGMPSVGCLRLSSQMH